MELRVGGATFEQVARTLGYASRSTAQKAVVKALQADVTASSDLLNEYRQLLLRRCERLLLAAWPAAIRGDTKAIRAVVQLLDRESALLGVDAPVQVAVTDVTQTGLSDLVDDLERLDAVARERTEALRQEVADLRHRIVALTDEATA